ncbi:class I SAM-dependent methyltransferase [Streptomyces sp. NPDC057909]|uniref:class I SAM-dependent methyltransferase n=1 Tax=Streptomyces sp. NPDC057909 TaxID=3346277 RepID=UPI0036F05434
MDERSSVLQVGFGTGQATRSLAALGCSVTAVEPGADMAALARHRIASFRNVEVETSTFEEWDNRGDASMSSWLRRRGTGLTRRLAGSERTTCSIPEAGWRCSATSLSAGRENRGCMPRPPISTSGSAQGTLIGVIRHSKKACAAPMRVGAWTIPENCLAQQSWLSEVSGGRAGAALRLAIRRHGRLGRPHCWVSPA